MDGEEPDVSDVLEGGTALEEPAVLFSLVDVSVSDLVGSVVSIEENEDSLFRG